MEAIGKINVYICDECNEPHSTINLSNGVTPFMTSCPHCRGTAVSQFYRIPVLAVSHAWVRPADLTRDYKPHIYNGGLIKIPLVDPDDITTEESLQSLKVKLDEKYN